MVLEPDTLLLPLPMPMLVFLLLAFALYLVHSSSPGGVAVSASHGRIVCDNTLSSRLSVVYQELLPKIRGMLFPSF